MREKEEGNEMHRGGAIGERNPESCISPPSTFVDRHSSSTELNRFSSKQSQIYQMKLHGIAVILLPRCNQLPTFRQTSSGRPQTSLVQHKLHHQITPGVDSTRQTPVEAVVHRPLPLPLDDLLSASPVPIGMRIGTQHHELVNVEELQACGSLSQQRRPLELLQLYPSHRATHLLPVVFPSPIRCRPVASATGVPFAVLVVFRRPCPQDHHGLMGRTGDEAENRAEHLPVGCINPHLGEASCTAVVAADDGVLLQIEERRVLQIPMAAAYDDVVEGAVLVGPLRIRDVGV